MLLPIVARVPSLDLRLKIVPVSEAVDALAKVSGIRLETDPKVAERKITVLVSHVDATETMARIADVMRLAWERQKNGSLRLTKDVVLENRERAQIEAERTEAARHFESNLRTQASEVSVTDEARAKRIAKAKERLDEAIRNREGNESILEAFFVLGEAGRQPTPLGVALATLSPGDWDRMLSGEPMLFSAGPKPYGRPIPNQAIGLVPPSSHRSPVVGLDILVRIAPPGEPGGAAEIYRTEDGWAGGGSASPTRPHLTRRAVRTRLTEELEAWDQKELTGSEAERKLNSATEERALEWSLGASNSHVPRQFWNVSDSDRLEWLHDASGINVVARADRLASDRGQRRFDGTVAAFVRDWRVRQSIGVQDSFRLVGRTLMFRPARYWERAQEPSEATLRPFEARKNPGLDDWAAFATRLTPAQARSLGYGVTLLRRGADPLVSETALRFWAVLTPTQRVEAQKRPLTAADLDGSQCQAFVRAMLSAAFERSFRPATLMPLLSGDASKIRFSLSGTDGWSIGGGSRDNYDWSMALGPQGRREGPTYPISRPAPEP